MRFTALAFPLCSDVLGFRNPPWERLPLRALQSTAEEVVGCRPGCISLKSH